jgi:hypothetical protein
VDQTLCSCGSGRAFTRCHGDPANEFARVQALAEAREVALLFPDVRIDSQRVKSFAEPVAAELAESEQVPEAALEEGALLLSAKEARALVDAWTAVYPDRWASLCHTAADVEAAERELVKGAVAAEIYERLSTPRALLIELELVELSPTPALALLLPPQFVWAYDEARAAAVALPDQIDEIAAALGRFAHVERVRRLAGFLGRELPFRDFPRATATLLEACDEVAHDVPFCRAVSTLCLLAYVRELEPLYITSTN